MMKGVLSAAAMVRPPNLEPNATTDMINNGMSNIYPNVPTWIEGKRL